MSFDEIEYDEALLFLICDDVTVYAEYYTVERAKTIELTDKLKKAVFLCCKYRLHGFSVATANALSVGEVYPTF